MQCWNINSILIYGVFFLLRMNSFAVPERTLIQLETNDQMTSEFYCLCLVCSILQSWESLSANIWNTACKQFWLFRFNFACSLQLCQVLISWYFSAFNFWNLKTVSLEKCWYPINFWLVSDVWHAYIANFYSFSCRNNIIFCILNWRW